MENESENVVESMLLEIRELEDYLTELVKLIVKKSIEDVEKMRIQDLVDSMYLFITLNV